MNCNAHVRNIKSFSVVWWMASIDVAKPHKTTWFGLTFKWIVCGSLILRYFTYLCAMCIHSLIQPALKFCQMFPFTLNFHSIQNEFTFWHKSMEHQVKMSSHPTDRFPSSTVRCVYIYLLYAKKDDVTIKTLPHRSYDILFHNQQSVDDGFMAPTFLLVPHYDFICRRGIRSKAKPIANSMMHIKFKISIEVTYKCFCGSRKPGEYLEMLGLLFCLNFRTIAYLFI